VVVVLFNEGDQFPDIPLILVVGNADKFPPVHIADTGVNIGTGCVPVISY
jgi:hypothetical protein